MNDDQYLPALSMFVFRDGRARRWAVTVNEDYDPDGHSIIVTFATKEEAEAFILAEQRRQSAVAPL